MTRPGSFLAAASSAVALALVLTPSAALAATDDGGLSRPASIPALQEWTPESGTYELSDETRIVLRPENAAQLADVAETFAGDLASLGAGHTIVVTSAEPVAHDIVLSLDAAAASSDAEGYDLAVGPAIEIESAGVAGAFYATRTLVQFFQQGATVTAGHASDTPAYEERGLMVDLGRMPITYDWLANAIRDMAYLKLNTLHLHLTDSEGWRVESEYVPASEGALTKDELRSLVALAARNQVTIIPEIDLPSHQGKLLEVYPEFQLESPDGPQCDPSDVAGCTAEGNKMGRLDYSIPAARQLLRDVIAEYIGIFPGPYWHLGADEYLGSTEYTPYPQLLQYAQENIGPAATANDGYIFFINEMNDFVKSHGKQARMWNDVVAVGTTPQVDTDIVIDWWTDADSSDIVGSVVLGTGPYAPYTPQALLNRGYEVLNSSFLPTYTSPPGGQTVAPSYECLYSTFDVTEFFGYLYDDTAATGGTCGPMFGLPYKMVAPQAEGLTGARVTMWNSTQANVPPWTEAEGWDDVSPRLRVMAQRTWGSAEFAADGAAFEALMADVGTAPAAALDVSTDLWSAPGTGDSTTISVASTLATAISDDADWLSVQDAPGGLTVSAGANTAAVARTATITVSAGSLARTVTVIQDAAPVTGAPDPGLSSPSAGSPATGGSIGGGALTGGRSGSAANTEALAATGGTSATPIAIFAGFLMLAGAALVARRRRQRA